MLRGMGNSGKLGTGYIPSPPDYRNNIAAVAAAAVAPAFKLATALDNDLTFLGPVMMQAQEPACVSHSIALILKLYFFQTTGKVIDFSPRFLDTLVKRYDGLGDPTNRATQGTYPQLVLKLAATFGCATQATLPNDTTLPVLQYRNDSLLTPAVFAEAAQYKIPGYIHVASDFNALRGATQLYGALSIGMFIGAEWWTPSWAPKDIDPLRTPNPEVSGHQVVMKGWKSATLNMLRNSWSAAWCNEGEASFDGNAWLPFIQEAWAIAELPQDVVDFLKSLPAPADFHYEWLSNMSEGMQSKDIEMLQVAFMILGYLQPIQPAEFGYFGPKTAAANLAYQLANKIAPTSANDVGPLTRASLNTRFAV